MINQNVKLIPKNQKSITINGITLTLNEKLISKINDLRKNINVKKINAHA